MGLRISKYPIAVGVPFVFLTYGIGVLRLAISSKQGMRVWVRAKRVQILVEDIVTPARNTDSPFLQRMWILNGK
ncbi:hypothetical protein D3C73_1189190 [compost metagenome]